MTDQKRRVYAFGAFRLDALKRELLRDDSPVKLYPKQLDLLLALVERAGDLVTKDELLRIVWPDAIVEEGNLTTHVSQLRKLLGGRGSNREYIVTLPGRGYRFVAPLREPISETLPRHGYRFIGSVQPVTDPAPPHPTTEVASATPRLRRMAIATVLGVAAVAAVLSVSHARGWRLLSGAPVDEIRSLAVLTFENLTGDPGQEYLADGITDELTTHLAQTEGLTVVSRTTAKRHEAAATPAPDIGRDLNVDALVQGAVVRSGQHLRISARVIQAAKDRYVWARSYDGEMGDIIALQRRIAGDVAAAIGRALPPDRAHRSQRIDPAAADAYLKGVFAAGQGGYEGIRTAVGYFEDAVARQPDYAEAHAFLAQAQLTFLFAGPLSPRQIIPKAEAAARKAIELDETQPQPHQSLGTILTHFHWKWEEGEREFQRARQLRVNGETGVTGGGAPIILRKGQLDDVIAKAARNRSRDPRSLSARIGLAAAYRAAAQYDRAIDEFRSAFELQPGQPRVHFHVGVTFVLMGHPHQAIPELERAVKPVGGNARMLSYLGYAYADAGRTDDARKVLNELVSRSKKEYVSSFGIALIHDVLGEKELALVALERAYQDRAVEFVLSDYPPFKTLSSDPRYHAIMKRIGLPP